MTRRIFYGLCGMFCLGLCLVYHIPAFADEWVLDEILMEDSDPEDREPAYQVLTLDDLAMEEPDPDEEELDEEIASPGNATSEGMQVVIVKPRASYREPYEGNISTTYLTYARDIVSKLPPGVNYVLFRSDQYSYRLVYADDLTLDGDRFSSASASYVSWDTGNYSRYDTFETGYEGSFSLTAGSHMVYTSLPSGYPTLESGVKNYEFKALLFVSVLSFLTGIIGSFFRSGKYRI